ncbi:hypothetical protein BLNAU_21448 [Blattamonas nauphoetae]|uniref:Uncharacterized protein n=1 Tax=Blattamonas nauphoetae TaxID=2049346 RepID=A0ABQ9WY44_9EUKA|nr:hypothetical protein BLNAU_21448 [Blattamonas nauphoetae]
MDQPVISAVARRNMTSDPVIPPTTSFQLVRQISPTHSFHSSPTISFHFTTNYVHAGLSSTFISDIISNVWNTAKYRVIHATNEQKNTTATLKSNKIDDDGRNMSTRIAPALSPRLSLARTKESHLPSDSEDDMMSMNYPELLRNFVIFQHTHCSETEHVTYVSISILDGLTC